MKHGDTIASPLWVGFEGKSLPVSLSRWLAGGHVGGVVLYARNIESPPRFAPCAAKSGPPPAGGNRSR